MKIKIGLPIIFILLTLITWYINVNEIETFHHVDKERITSKNLPNNIIYDNNKYYYKNEEYKYARKKSLIPFVYIRDTIIKHNVRYTTSNK